MHYLARAPQNLLLSALPADARTRLAPELQLVDLEAGSVLFEPGETIDFAYLPINSIVMLLNPLENGATTEVALIGNEGLVGVSAFLGGGSAQCRAVVQSQGQAHRIRASCIKQEFDRHKVVQSTLLYYTQSLMTHVGQTAVCNRFHTTEQQLCRWLLLSLDRHTSNTLFMTQELIANFLGVRRESVTAAAGKLMRIGAIEYRRGRITVLNRAHLESQSCECYSMFKAESNRLTCFASEQCQALAA